MCEEEETRLQPQTHTKKAWPSLRSKVELSGTRKQAGMI